MAHFAQVDENNVVTRVLVIDRDEIDGGDWGDPSSWIQTSYNTRAGVHYGPDGYPDGGVALRKNYAGEGYAYDPALDAFIPPKNYPSWVLNEQTCLWNAPYPAPEGEYYWDEQTQSWVKA